jgi:hypothetical protein
LGEITEDTGELPEQPDIDVNSSEEGSAEGTEERSDEEVEKTSE